jgi:hypothetical protein
MDPVCSVCGAASGRRPLMKCPICFKPFCEACAFALSGRIFCTRYCAEYFFHEGDEDE